MKNSDAVFSGSMPATYDKYLGPALFEPYAKDLAGRIAPSAPSSVLEIAAGTGIVTRHLVEALPHASVIATDLNPGMVQYAAAALDRPNLTWRQADALDLPFADEMFDAVVCQFGVMFFPDKAKGFREVRRVLRDGGRFSFSVWDRIEENELASAVEAAMEVCFPDDPPRFISRTPHGYHDTAAIASELQLAGYSDIAFETVPMQCRAESARGYALGLCTGSPLRSEIEARDATRLDEAVKAATEGIEARFGSAEPHGKMQAFIFTATR